MAQAIQGNSHLYQIDRYYTSANYKKKFIDKTEPGDRNTGLHFLIARNQKTSIPKEVVRLQKSGQVDYPDKAQAGLTALMVAVIFGNPDAVEELLDAGASPLVQDNRTWTALDHAALLGDKTIFYKLAGRVGQAGHRLLAQPPRAPDQPVFYYRDAQGDVLPGTAEKFQEMVGVPFQAGIVGDRLILIEDWRSSFRWEVESPTTQVLLAHVRVQWEKMRGRTPDIYLGRDKNSIGRDVFTRRSFESVEFIDLYSGKQIPKAVVQKDDEKQSSSKENLEYLCEDVDANTEAGRNLASEICDSFPNCCFFPVFNVDGFQKMQMVIALDRIPKDRRLCVNYGENHKVKSFSHTELNRSEMFAYFRQNSLDQLFARVIQLRNIKNDLKTAAESWSVIHKLLYIFETSSALVDLLFSGVLNPKDVLRVMKSPDFTKTLNKLENTGCIGTSRALCEIADRLLTVMGASGPLPQSVKEKMSQFILEACCTMYGLSLVNILRLLDHEMGDICTLPDWDAKAREYRLLSTCWESLLQQLEAIQKTKGRADKVDILALMNTIGQSKMSQKRKKFVEEEWFPVIVNRYFPEVFKEFASGN